MLKWQNEARNHAMECFPRESCGLLIQGKLDQPRYYPCRNISAEDGNFRMHPGDYVSGTRQGTIVGVVHSHPRGPRVLTETDVECMRRGDVPWWVYDCQTQTYSHGSPEDTPLRYRGHAYDFGRRDCGTIISLFYKNEFDIDLPRPHVESVDFWRDGLSTPYEDAYRMCGMYEIPKGQIRFGDVVMFKVHGSQVVNHAAIALSPGQLLHHAAGKISAVVAYSERLVRATALCVRHPDVCEMLSARRARAFVWDGA